MDKILSDFLHQEEEKKEKKSLNSAKSLNSLIPEMSWACSESETFLVFKKWNLRESNILRKPISRVILLSTD